MTTGANETDNHQLSHTSDLYTFTGAAGQTATFTLSNGNPSFVLYGPNDQAVALNSSSAAILPEPGTYTLAVLSNAPTNDYAPYTFGFTLANPATVTATGFNTSNSGTLAANGSTTFTFKATGGQAVYLNDQLADFAVTYSLADSKGNVVYQENKLSAPIASPFFLLAGGTYTLTVQNRSKTDTADFQFKFDTLPDQATTLTLNSVVTGTLPADNTANIYKFTGSPGQAVYLNAQGNEFQSEYDLFAPDGSLVNFSTDNFDFPPLNPPPFSTNFSPTTLTQAGTYYLIRSAGTLSTPKHISLRLTT